MLCFPAGLIVLTPPLLVQDLVARKLPLTKAALASVVDSVRGAVMICYPMGECVVVWRGGCSHDLLPNG